MVRIEAIDQRGYQEEAQIMTPVLSRSNPILHGVPG
jgi:hypothetical protein